MQVLSDIWASIKGNAKTRIRDPLVGAFIVSWCTCNWDKLAVLYWGKKSIDERIKDMALSMKFSQIYSDIDLLLLPTLLTLFYLFALPWLSYGVKKTQNKAIQPQHSLAIKQEIAQARNQIELNKANLRANPEKEFLAEEVKLDLQRERERNERRNKIQSYIDLKVKRAKDEAEVKAAEAEKERLDLESKKRQEEREKQKFEAQSAINRATLASNRFPAAYQLMSKLSESLKQDGITLSLGGLAHTIAYLFGYDTVDEMLNDEKFNNSGLQKVKYIYHNSANLTQKLEDVVNEEDSDNEDLSDDLLFDHLLSTLEDSFSLDLLSDDALAEKVAEAINENSLDLLSGDELSGAMAVTDTIFEEVWLDLDSFNYNINNGLTLKMSGSASGSHRKEVGIPSQELNVSVTAQCTPLIGKYGLQDYQLEVHGAPRYD